MTPTWKEYEITHLDRSRELVSCYKAQISEDGKRVEFIMPSGSFIIREGMIDPGGWSVVASYVIENIVGYRLKREKKIG